MSRTPSTPVPDAKTTAALLRRFWAFMRPHKRWIVIGLAMIPLVAGLTALRPLLIKHVVDESIPEGNLIELRVVGIAFMVAVVAEFLCQAAQVYTLQRGGHAAISDVRRHIFAHVMRLPNRFFDKHALGNLLTRTTSDVEALSETLSFGVFMILTDIVMIISIVAAMFALSWWLALITLAVAPVLILLVRYVGGVLRRLQLDIRKAQAIQNGFLTEQLTGITVVQLFGREKAAHDEYRHLGQRYLKATKLANIYDAGLYSIMDGISAFAIALMIYFATPSALTQGGAVTVGLLFAFVDYLQRVFVPIKEFSSKLATLQRASASLERIFGLLDEPTEDHAPAGAPDPLATWDGSLRVKDLRFAYGEAGPDILRGLDFDVAPGEVVALVGRTGSGKSSIGRVLTQLYGGYRGSIELLTRQGPIELRDVPPNSLRRHVLMVQQDVFLFNDDIAFNVSLGAPDICADEACINRALEVVQAQRIVDERGGLRFEVGERGGNLSGGEAQLIAFARVAARAPTLLILDEATANVDSLTEQKVQAAIERLLHGRSVIVIAHRLSTVRRADKILVMHEGRIVEQGRHEQLMAQNGRYAELYQMGFDDDAEPTEPTQRGA